MRNKPGRLYYTIYRFNILHELCCIRCAAPLINSVLIVSIQEKRINALDALAHPYLEEGRLRYHSCMCKCCMTAAGGRQYCPEFEPTSLSPFSYAFEEELTSVYKVKGDLSCLLKKLFKNFDSSKKRKSFVFTAAIKVTCPLIRHRESRAWAQQIVRRDKNGSASVDIEVDI